MPERSTFVALASVLADLRAEPPESITPATRLREDLGVDGDDWDEVLNAIDARWPMDWAGFDFYSFFDEEPNWLSLLRAIRNMMSGRKLKPLTVGHLAFVLQHGKWSVPPEAAA